MPTKPHFIAASDSLTKLSCLVSSTLPLAQQPPNTPKKTDSTASSFQSFNQHGIGESNKLKNEEIQKSVSARMEYNTELEQDHMEGVDADEWNE